MFSKARITLTINKSRILMSNKDKYDKVFMDSFSIDKAKVGKNLVYESISEWDSVGHIE